MHHFDSFLPWERIVFVLHIAFSLTQISCMQIKKLRGRQGNEYAKHAKEVYCYGHLTVHLKQTTTKYEHCRTKTQQFCIKIYENKDGLFQDLKFY